MQHQLKAWITFIDTHIQHDLQSGLADTFFGQLEFAMINGQIVHMNLPTPIRHYSMPDLPALPQARKPKRRSAKRKNRE